MRAGAFKGAPGFWAWSDGIAIPATSPVNRASVARDWEGKGWKGMTSGPHWSAAGECVNWSRETCRAGRTGSREMGLARAGLGSGAVEWAARRWVWLGRDDRAAARVAGPKGKGAGWAKKG